MVLVSLEENLGSSWEKDGEIMLFSHSRGEKVNNNKVNMTKSVNMRCKYINKKVRWIVAITVMSDLDKYVLKC